MSEQDAGQISGNAAQVYEQFFVPALFIEWPDRVLDAAGVGTGDSVLDVACGTGVLARRAAERVGPEGRVVGLDLNNMMLDVARSKSADVEWRQGAAESLPFDDDSFDHTVSQFGLMFFQDREQALREMMRVTRPGGTVAVAVWASLNYTPGYTAVRELLEEQLGPEAAQSLDAPYVLGEPEVVRELLVAAGADPRRLTVTVTPGKARFKSLDEWMYSEIKGWTLADSVDDAGFKALLAAAPGKLSDYVLPNGSVELESPAIIAVLRL